MTDPMDLSAEQLLAIDISAPEKIFTLDKFEFEFRKLRRKWHPDVNASEQANEVFVHIMNLAETAKGRIATDSWNGRASLKFTTASGKTFRFQYRKFRAFELGRMYIGTHKVVYVIDGENEDLYRNGIRMIESIRYPNDKFKKEFSRFLPNIVLKEKTDVGYVVVMDKPEGAVLLQDLIDYMSDPIDPKHVAWVTSSLYNTVTFLDHVGICHNSILPTTVFIDPKNHALFLLGGWWYATKKGDKLKAIPSELTKVLPSKVFDDKIASSTYDRQAVKCVAISCLGDSTLVGSRLLTNKEIPNAMLTWLRTPSGDDSVEEYEGWYKVLEKSFGKRKFVELNVDINEIY
jgi:hypothetical protein